MKMKSHYWFGQWLLSVFSADEPVASFSFSADVEPELVLRLLTTESPVKKDRTPVNKFLIKPIITTAPAFMRRI
jgi:hypothetical protein